MITDETAARLRNQGYRLTPQRLAILRILGEAGAHLSPQELFQQAQELLPGITEATIYRTLSFLVEQGLVLAAHVGSGQLVYELADHAHHHLICRACGASLEIDHNLVEALYRRLETDTGYQLDSLHLTFFGLCPECQGE